MIYLVLLLLKQYHTNIIIATVDVYIIRMPNPNARPPKKRRASAFSRKIRGGNKKRSSFDHVAARESLGLPRNANAQQIRCAVDPSNTNTVDNPSPLKKEVKARLAEQVNKNLLLTKVVSEAQKNVTQQTNQIQTLKQKVRDLSDALQVEYQEICT